MNVEQGPCMHQDLKDATIIVRSLDTKPLNADPSPHSHQTREEAMKIPLIGITIQDIAVTIVKSMDTFLRITLKHILEATTIDG